MKSWLNWRKCWILGIFLQDHTLYFSSPKPLIIFVHLKDLNIWPLHFVIRRQHSKLKCGAMGTGESESVCLEVHILQWKTGDKWFLNELNWNNQLKPSTPDSNPKSREKLHLFSNLCLFSNFFNKLHQITQLNTIGTHHVLPAAKTSKSL